MIEYRFYHARQDYYYVERLDISNCTEDLGISQNYSTKLNYVIQHRAGRFDAFDFYTFPLL